MVAQINATQSENCDSDCLIVDEDSNAEIVSLENVEGPCQNRLLSPANQSVNNVVSPINNESSELVAEYWRIFGGVWQHDPNDSSRAPLIPPARLLGVSLNFLLLNSG